MPEPRPFLFFNDGSQFGLSISRTEFRRMRRAEKLEVMIDWFFQNYEDPVHSLPYESAEGGYIWIWGGPYNARDELGGKFSDLVSEKLIEEAVEEIQRDGLRDWAPVHKTTNYDDTELEEPVSLDLFSDEPGLNYGTSADHESRERIRTALELRLALDTPRPVGIGHNRPPLEDEEPDEIKELRSSVPELRAELAKANPKISLVKRCAGPLRDALIASSRWAWKKLDTGLDEAAKAVGKAADRRHCVGWRALQRCSSKCFSGCCELA